MRLVDVLDSCRVKTVTAVPEVSLAEAARAMHDGDAAAIIVDSSRFQGILTAVDLLRHLALAATPNETWQVPVTAALGDKVATVSCEETVGRTIEKMTAAGIDHLPVATAQGIVVTSLCRLLLAENALLHGEVQHLQNYIDALHDAPND
jgi:CBS domain-containing protein